MVISLFYITKNKKACKMKIFVASDLHMEFGSYDYALPNADVYVFAGDIHTETQALEWFENLNLDKPIIYITGNHEYYSASKSQIKKKKAKSKDEIDFALKQHNLKNLHVLQNDSVVIDGVKFFGSTFWTDINNNDPTLLFMLKKTLNDFVYILDDKTSGSPPKTWDTNNFCSENAIARVCLHEDLKDWQGKSVVITHHAPSFQSLDGKIVDDTNYLYANTRIENWIADIKPTVWIHGHTHHCVDYMLDQTRIVSNQHGYKKYAEVKEYNPNKVIEI